MSFITVAGQTKIAQCIANGTPLNIVSFVFANISGLGAEPSDRVESLPSSGNIVDTKTVGSHGFVSANKVIYSRILDSTVGDYQFNWVGLKDVDGVLIACEHIPLQTKTKTAGMVQGNNLARNFLLEFNGAQSISGITTPAETWQFNFNNRLLQIDERERLSNYDEYGDGTFFDTGFLVTHGTGSAYTVNAGDAFIGGIRCYKSATTALTNAVGTAKDVWMDASLQGDINGVDAVIAFTLSSTTLANYTDSLGFKHYVFKIAAIDIAGNVTDLRPLWMDKWATKVGVQGAIYSSAVASGSANALIGAFSPAIATLVHGMTFHVRAAYANTNSTPNFTPNNGVIAAKTIVKGLNYPLAIGDILGLGDWLDLKYDATFDKMILLNPATGNAGYLAITANTTITAASVGQTIAVNGGVTVTLPLINTVPVGVPFRFISATSGIVTIQRQSTDTFAISGGGTTSTTFRQGGFCEVISDGVNWRVISSKEIGNNKSDLTSGSWYTINQDGLITQGGWTPIVPANSGVFINYPIALTTNAYSLVVTAGAASVGQPNYSGVTTTDLTRFSIFNSSGVTATLAGFWFMVGK